MTRQIFINLPVNDLPASMTFFKKLGFEFNPQFTNDEGACMVISETIFVMLLVKPFFKQFTKKEVTDASKSTEVLLCLSAESREKVDEMVSFALEAGAKSSVDKQDHGWMYQHGFEDLDGHLWEIAFMDENYV